MKQFYFKHFSSALVICLHSVYTSNSSMWPIHRTISCATTPDQRGRGGNCNEGELFIHQSSSITGASQTDCIMSYARHTFVGLTPRKRCCQCILQHQITAMSFSLCELVSIFFSCIFISTHFLRDATTSHVLNVTSCEHCCRHCWNGFYS